ncbi:hypothetical protein [Chitinophaga sp. MM2321]|uniref:hypothetical protein n=1 Tax=Chitinophaga sp. MM2321 TaxID=3137178 RepID=UPI0032D58B15
MLIVNLCLSTNLRAGTMLADTTGRWIGLGTTEGGAPYTLYYYKLLQVNGAAHRYASIIELSVQGNANYFDRQGTYRIRVDKFENTPGSRFDGLEVKCISGNPGVASFYVFNDALWVRSNFQWGSLYYRTVADFGKSPLNAAPYGQTITAPVGFVASSINYGLKCDFDNNKYYKLSYEDVQGNLAVAGKIGIGTAPAYTLHTVASNNSGTSAAYLWGEFYGVTVGILNTTAAQHAFAVLNNVNANGSGATGGGKALFFV